MSDKYKIFDNSKAYFITMTVVGWIDLFTHYNHKIIIVDSLKYCQNHKGLEIFGWCLMSSHLHMICRVTEGYHLSDVLRDFKKFTSKKLVHQIKEANDSRQEWLLPLLESYCKHLKKEQKFKVWQDGNHAEIIETNHFFDQKLNYMHNNPVEEQIVEHPEDYLFSSARNYAGLSNMIDIIVESFG